MEINANVIRTKAAGYNRYMYLLALNANLWTAPDTSPTGLHYRCWLGEIFSYCNIEIAEVK